MIKLAHISDVHLGPLPGIKPTELMSKRITGYLNWKFNRAHHMHSDTLERLVAHLKVSNPDFCAITGDMMNLSTKKEVAHVAQWLENFMPPEQACVVPGNHDAYVPGVLEQAKQSWKAYMSGQSAEGETFPYVRTVGEVAIIGCSSAVATPPFFSNGRIDDAQNDRLADILKQTGQQGLFRVVLIHHPPVDIYARSFMRGLRGASGFRNAIRHSGAELVLHGHLHTSMINAIEGLSGEVPVIGVASASANAGKGEQPARYNLFSIERLRNNWSCTMTEYGYHGAGDDIAAGLQTTIY